jgi:hypothetical protein
LAAWSIHRAEQGDLDVPIAEYYIKMIQDYVHPELSHSKLIRPLLWAGPEEPRRPLMKAVVGVGANTINELFHGIRVYRWLRPRGRELHDVV